MVKKILANVRIVLVEPAGPRNVGAVVRVMKNMGLHTLVLVNPQCDPLGTEAQQMAVHAVDVLENARVVATLPEALQGCQRAIATTARARTLSTQLEHPRTALPWLLDESISSALIFGPEDRGLSNAELNYAQRFVRIPSHPDYPSLNLAQAVGICCYELYQHWLVVSGQESVEDEPLIERHHQNVSVVSTQERVNNQISETADSQLLADIAPLDVLEGYYQQLEAVLLKIGYLYPHTAVSRMEKFRRLFNRATPSTAEVAMLRGILRQTEWALQSLPPSVEGDSPPQDPS